MHKIIQSEGLSFRGEIKLTFQNIETKKRRVSNYKNVIVTVCKTMIAKRLAGEANDCNITYIAIGTGAGTPAIGDTTLFTELVRKVLTDIDYTTTSVICYGYFGATEAVGTLTEIGLFGEAASATVNSGTMINHASITELKTNVETLTVEIHILLT